MSKNGIENVNNFVKLDLVSGYHDWYDEKTHTGVFPFDTYNNDTEHVEQQISNLQKLGCSVIGKIDMPISLWRIFVLAKLPASMTLDRDEDEMEYEYKDKKGRSRLRVLPSNFNLITNIWTRYLIQHEFKDKHTRMVPIVRDIDTDDEETIIKVWEGTNTKDLDMYRPAKKWLDKNYPLWQDPTAYWT